MTTQQIQLPCDRVVSGPPCIAYSPMGKREAESSIHFDPLVAVVTMVVHLAKNGLLVFALLENVVGTLQWVAEHPPIFPRIVLTLREQVPEFVWGLDKMLAHLYGLGAHRRRVFLKSVRRKHVSVPAVPPPLPPLPRR